MRSIHDSLRRCNVLANGKKHTVFLDQDLDRNQNNSIELDELDNSTNNFNPLNQDQETPQREKKSRFHPFFKGLDKDGNALTRGSVPHCKLIGSERALTTAVKIWGIDGGFIKLCLDLLGIKEVKSYIEKIAQMTTTRSRSRYLTTCLINACNLAYPNREFLSVAQLHGDIVADCIKWGAPTP